MIVTVDIGTTAVKASALDHDGRELAAASESSSLSFLDGGRVEQDLDQVIEAVAAVIAKTLSQLDTAPTALAITGQGDGLWLRRADGSAVRPAVSWMDARAATIVDQWHESGVFDELYALTGSAVFPGSQGPLLAWFAENEPESLAEAAVAGYCTDAVIHRLCGVVTVSASDASMPFLDVSTREYSRRAIALCGLQDWAHLLATPASDDEVFALTDLSAALLGLPAGLPVVNAQYDLVSCALGLGARAAGDGVIILGTTLACEVVTAAPPPAAGSEPAGMWLCAPLDGLWIRAMPSMVGTAAIDWVLALVGATIDQFDSLLAESPSGASEVRAFSFFGAAGERAPFVEPRARARFTNLSLETSRADLVRATAESVAYAARHSLEAAGAVTTVAVGGGGSKSPRWLQLLADVLGRPVTVQLEGSAGNRGAAMTAFAALGSPVDHSAWTGQTQIFHPDAELSRRYEDRFATYLSEVEKAREEWQSSR